MNALFHFLFRPAQGPAGVLLNSPCRGTGFLILKYIDTNMGVVRAKAEQHQCATDDFRRTYKVCGEVRVRKSDLRERSPNYSGRTRGFWYTVSDARTDFAMFCSLILILVGGR